MLIARNCWKLCAGTKYKVVWGTFIALALSIIGLNVNVNLISDAFLLMAPLSTGWIKTIFYCHQDELDCMYVFRLVCKEVYKKIWKTLGQNVIFDDYFSSNSSNLGGIETFSEILFYCTSWDTFDFSIWFWFFSLYNIH